MVFRTPIATLRHALAVAVVVLLAVLIALGLHAGHARAAGSLGSLQSRLGAAQQRSASLSESIIGLNGTIATLDRQISLVQGREASVRLALATERAALVRVRGQLGAERSRLATLRGRLTVARRLLAVQLRSGYESAQPNLVDVLLQARGFSDLLTQLSFLHRAEGEQRRLIGITVSAKRAASQAAARLASLRATDARIARGELLESRALIGMNSLLSTKQAAVNRARAAQSAALVISQATGRRLRSQIASVKAAQLRAAQQRAAAAAAAAARAAASGSNPGPGGSGGSGGSGASGSAPSGGSGGWAIPEQIVMCESGGQNLPPNSAGASGYYQIIPSTWKGFGGTGPAAWLASLPEQSAVAARIWNGGAGASNWVCAGIVGIH